LPGHGEPERVRGSKRGEAKGPGGGGDPTERGGEPRRSTWLFQPGPGTRGKGESPGRETGPGESGRKRLIELRKKGGALRRARPANQRSWGYGKN